MKVYRLCDKNEIDIVFKSKSFNSVGNKFEIDPKKNTHQYLQDTEYIHFFKKPISLLYLSLLKGKYICVYNIPDSILQQYEGTGLYLDFIFFRNLHQIAEYAIPSKNLEFNYLEKIFLINEDIDFEYYPESTDEVMNSLTCIYDFSYLKRKLEIILQGDNVATLLEDNLDDILMLIPEIKDMIGFDHKHPHHHLDVWQHTLEVIRQLDTKDIELNMAALLHDIGKPFSYQEGEVRHFHGHPEVSYIMAKQILERLGYDEQFINNVTFLVRNHDTIIDVNHPENNSKMTDKLLQLQYADARAHHPDKVAKRINFLDNIRQQLHIKEIEFER